MKFQNLTLALVLAVLSGCTLTNADAPTTAETSISDAYEATVTQPPKIIFMGNSFAYGIGCNCSPNLNILNYAAEGAGLIAKKQGRASRCQANNSMVERNYTGTIPVPPADSIRGNIVILSLGVNDLSAKGLSAQDYYDRHWLPFVKDSILKRDPAQLIILMPAQRTIDYGNAHYRRRYGDLRKIFETQLPEEKYQNITLSFAMDSVSVFDRHNLHPRSYTEAIQAIQNLTF